MKEKSSKKANMLVAYFLLILMILSLFVGCDFTDSVDAEPSYIGMESVLHNETNSGLPIIFGDRVVWSTSEGLNNSIILYNLSTKEKMSSFQEKNKDMQLIFIWIISYGLNEMIIFGMFIIIIL